jgi:hypothetical protein
MQTNLDPGAIRSQTLVLPLQRLACGVNLRSRRGNEPRAAVPGFTRCQFLTSHRGENLAWTLVALSSLAALVLSLWL